jgi:NAD(P)-dependent dehydrogenase (short-subunit alcohol dehydrogenase family)
MLADLGARHLCFLGRSGAQSPAARALLDRFAAEHVDAHAYACDVADESDLRRALAQ